MGQSACFHTFYISLKFETLYQTDFFYLPNTQYRNYFKTTKEKLVVDSCLVLSRAETDIYLMGKYLKNTEI